jgi:uracil-DNA glycosylase family 4
MSLEHDLELHAIRWANCVRCPIGKFAHTHCAYDYIPSERQPAPRVLFIGEAPGTVEDYRGLPFVGEAGRFLRDALCETGFLGELDVVLSNIVLCRPTNKPGGSNRDPTTLEADNCSDRLTELFSVVKPDLTVLTGRTAQEYGPRVVGHDYRRLFHPSYILRKGGRGTDDYERWIAQLNILKRQAQEVFNEAEKSREPAPAATFRPRR